MKFRTQDFLRVRINACLATRLSMTRKVIDFDSNAACKYIHLDPMLASMNMNYNNLYLYSRILVHDFYRYGNFSSFIYMRVFLARINKYIFLLYLFSQLCKTLYQRYSP